MYVATAELSSCGGCLNALLSVGMPIISLLGEHTVTYSTYLTDAREVTPCDVFIVTGGIRNQTELELAREISRTARKVVAVGSCAVFGGVAGQAQRGIAPEGESGGELESLLDAILPIDSHVDVELYLPGCPPPPGLILEMLKSVLEGDTPSHFNGTVCSTCKRRVESAPVEESSMHPGRPMPDDLCFLSSGSLCLGPVTRGGCHALCTERGAVCIGCRGPSDAVLSSQLHSLFSDMVKYMAMTTESDGEEAAERLIPMLRSLYMFTMKDTVTGCRLGERLGED